MSSVRQGLLVVLALAAIVGGCGGSGSSSSSVSSSGTGAASTGSTSNASGGAAALTPEAQTAATGDIPDNQVFLRFGNPTAGYSIRYPEGWARKGAGTDVSFVVKNNVIHITISRRSVPTTTSVASELSGLKQSKPSLSFSPPKVVTLGSGPAVRATYTTRSAPNPVTGKVIILIVDRYELGHGGKVATVDLGTPRGVDNIDAYRMIINSFRWQ